MLLQQKYFFIKFYWIAKTYYIFISKINRFKRFRKLTKKNLTSIINWKEGGHDEKQVR